MYAIIDALSDEVLAHGDTGRDLAPQVKGFKERGNTPRIVELPENEDWQKRELARMTDGTYSLVPWHGQDWYHSHPLMDVLYFPHVSQNDKAKLAYTQSPSRGREDRQTRVTPRAFLERFHPQLSAADVNYWVNLWEQTFSPYEVLFAKSADEIEYVYMSGPGSCMAYLPSKYQSTFHPVRVYAEGDLSLAYMKDRNGIIVARTLVWPDEKVFGRVYGTCGDYTSTFRKLLRAHGYASPHDYNSLAGARIGRFPDRDGKGIVCPYIDGNDEEDRVVYDTGEWLIVGNVDDDDYDDYRCLSADHTNGYADGMSFLTCHECQQGSWVNDGGFWARDNQWVCAHCADELYFSCESCGGRHRVDGSTVTQYDGRDVRICARCVSRYTEVCDNCGHQVIRLAGRPSTMVNIHPVGRVCRDCADRHYFRCYIYGVYYPNSMLAGQVYAPFGRSQPVSTDAAYSHGFRFDPFLNCFVDPFDGRFAREQEHDDPSYPIDGYERVNMNPRIGSRIPRSVDTFGNLWFHCPTF